MRAYVLEKKQKRPTLVERPAPEPAPGAVVVQVTAVAIHPVDLETADGGNAMLMPNPRPFVPGVDFAGTVVQVGAGVDRLEVGDVVFGYRGIAAQGAFAEQIIVPADEVAVAPALPIETLAALPLPALCALQAVDEAGLTAPGTVLVHGGAGGVGHVAVQVLSRLGHRVVATASARDAEAVRGWGADEVVDYQTTRFEDVVSEVDLVLDTVGGDTLSRSFAVVKPGGTVASLNAMPAAEVLRSAGMNVPWFMGALLPLMGMGARRKAKAAGATLSGQVTVQSGDRLARLAALSAERPLEARIDRTFDFAQLPAAMDHAASGTARGRVVVTLT